MFFTLLTKNGSLSNDLKDFILTETVSYKIRFFHGVDDFNKPLYSYKELNEKEYKELSDHLQFQRWLQKVNEAYEHSVLNYRDYELSNFSVILDQLLLTGVSLDKARIEINRQLLNILTSTYLYTSLLAITQKSTEKEKKYDYSLENSKDISIVHGLKKIFKNTVNKYHKEHYQYTFICELRNNLGHGGSIEKPTEMYGTWSIRYDHIESDDELLVAKKDKQYYILDQKILKQEVQRTLKTRHYEPIAQTIPESFHIREAVRIYIDLLSKAHAEIKEHAFVILETGDEIIKTNLEKCCGSHAGVSVIKCVNDKEHELSLRSLSRYLTTSAHSVKVPLHLEHCSMPGEPSAIPTPI